ncbi:MAG TPA: YfiR family protein [Chryseosolibacter sp.]
MRRCVLAVLLLIVCNFASAQGYKLHSVYVYGFTRYVEWPADYSSGDFEILVLGDSPIIDQLKEMATAKKVGDRSIKVTRIATVAELKKCNILFIPAAQSAQFATALTKIGSQSTLVITEEPGLGAKGSDINFITKDGKLAFELNQAAAAKHNLKISNALMGMAILI